MKKTLWSRVGNKIIEAENSLDPIFKDYGLLDHTKPWKYHSVLMEKFKSVGKNETAKVLKEGRCTYNTLITGERTNGKYGPG